jgi:hypothetical protein
MGFWTRLSRQNWKLKNRARTTQKAKSNIWSFLGTADLNK